MTQDVVGLRSWFVRDNFGLQGEVDAQHLIVLKLRPNPICVPPLWASNPGED